ncbi:hypothetical protein JHK82_018916 [Glycine max]|nr:hypothetical protein JHK85_019356 [Glycine max]KAG5038094.1 hypothetical protein JHK86_018934 [Glycine max]KAG5143221.1 hypothetical protein JHK82_018916 [Glycine max]
MEISGCGKMTLLKALAGKLEQSLKVCISKEETTKCRKIVCDPSYMSDKVQKVGKVACAICIMSHPIPDTKDSYSTQVILPQKQLGRKSDM